MNLNLLIKHSGIYFLSRGLPAILNLAGLALFTRLLAPDAYGRYALVIASAGLASSLLFQWWRLGLLRYLNGMREQRGPFLSTIMAGYCFLAAVAVIVAGIAASVFPDQTRLIVLGLAILVSEAWFEMNLEIARSQLTPWRYGGLSLVKAVVTLGLGGFLVWSGFGETGLLIGILASSTIALYAPVRREWRGIHPRLVDWQILRKLVGYSLPLMATIGLTYVLDSSDRFFLGYFLGTEAVGTYAVGYDLAQRTLGVLMVVVNLGAYPLLTRTLETEGMDEVRKCLRQSALLLLAVAIPATTGMVLLAPGIAHSLLGEAFQETAGRVIPWICLGALLGGVKAYYFDLAFQLSCRTMGQIWVVFAAAGLNTALNFLWIPTFGIMGAAYATVVSFAAALLLSWWLGRRVFPLPALNGESLKIVAASLLMALILWPTLTLPFGATVLCFQVLLGASAYVTFLLLFNVQGSRALVSRFFPRRSTE